MHMKLYHYTKQETFENFISKSALLRFTDPFGKNCINPDCKEYFYPKDAIMKFVSERIGSEITNRFLIELKNFCIKNIKNDSTIEKIERKTRDFRFLSCSKNPDNNYLIKEFANGKACRIEMDTEMLNAEMPDMFFVSDVFYADERSETDLKAVYSETVSSFLTKFENLKKGCNVKDENIDYSNDEKYINLLALLSAFIKTKDGNHEKEEETRILIDFGTAYREGHLFALDKNIAEILPSSFKKNNYLFLRKDERHAYNLLKTKNTHWSEHAYLILKSRIDLLIERMFNYYASIGVIANKEKIKENFVIEFVRYCMIVEPMNYYRDWLEPGDFFLSIKDLEMKNEYALVH